jgi:hypothetical protein
VSTQRKSIARGTSNHVFTENGNIYCCVGAQPGRTERGVQSGLYRLKYRFPSKEWDSMHRVLKLAEYAFDRYMDTDIIQHISCARSQVKFKQWSHLHCQHIRKLARYYNRLGFGINVYLRRHIDQDFTLSIVQAHINNHDYQVDDRILCYYVFPRIGIAVALWPDDFLLLNPQEPHSISYCCRQETKYFAFLLTLKWGLLVSMIIVTPLCNPATSSKI